MSPQENRRGLVRQGGFTLLEMIVVVTVLGFLMIGLTHGVRIVGDQPTGLGTTQRADITLELSRGRLVLSWTPHRHELTTATAPQPSQTELIGNVERLDLAYWGTPRGGQEAGWQSEWDGPAIPELIRVRLVLGENDRRRFPDLIAAPQS